jgi:hypothetical protein
MKRSNAVLCQHPISNLLSGTAYPRRPSDKRSRRRILVGSEGTCLIRSLDYRIRSSDLGGIRGRRREHLRLAGLRSASCNPSPALREWFSSEPSLDRENAVAAAAPWRSCRRWWRTERALEFLRLDHRDVQRKLLRDVRRMTYFPERSYRCSRQSAPPALIPLAATNPHEEGAHEANARQCNSGRRVASCTG